VRLSEPQQRVADSAESLKQPRIEGLSSLDVERIVSLSPGAVDHAGHLTACLVFDLGKSQITSERQKNTGAPHRPAAQVAGEP